MKTNYWNISEYKTFVIQCPACKEEFELTDSISGKHTANDLHFCIFCGEEL